MLAAMSGERSTLNGPESVAYRVRQGQARLIRGRRITVAELLDRDTWSQAAADLARFYFPTAARRGLTIQLEQVAEIYRAAFALFPLQYKLPGTLRPDWWHATVLSWMRRACSEHTRQLYLARFRVSESASADRALANAQRFAGLREADAQALRDAVELMADLAQADHRRGELARLVLMPWALADVDATWNERVRFTAYPSQRAKMRAAAKHGTVSYLRIHDEVWMFGDRYAAKRHEVPGGWRDVRDGEPVEWLDFWLRWVDGKGWDIRISNAQLGDWRAEAKAILTSKGNTTYRAMRMNDLAKRIRTRCEHATGCGRQLYELDRRLGRMFRQHLQANDRKLKWAGCRPTFTGKLVMPKPNPFAEADGCTYTQWRAMFSPWRLA